MILQHPKIMRDPHTGTSKVCVCCLQGHVRSLTRGSLTFSLSHTQGFGFINFAAFESSDSAIQAMNGQFLCNRSISVTYALKKDGQGTALLFFPPH